jgi:hypothetical protein
MHCGGGPGRCGGSIISPGMYFAIVELHVFIFVVLGCFALCFALPYFALCLAFSQLASLPHFACSSVVLAQFRGISLRER